MVTTIDPIELACFIVSIIAVCYAVYVHWRAHSVWKNALMDVTRAHLVGVAQRRVRQSRFHLLVQVILAIAATIFLFMPIGEEQSNLRTFIQLIISIFMLYLSAAEHWEQRAIDIHGPLRRRDDLPTAPPEGPKAA